MSVRVEVVCVNPDASEQRREVLTVEARELAMETLGMNLSEGKALLAGVQDFVVAQQVYEHLEQRPTCVVISACPPGGGDILTIFRWSRAET